eukprot:CAMPEP_0184671518 /NCGR_PEP_ID=MMETSP0308-20130426/85554_1 /TAXON_ID=38269 /ORGANISM="Gloeochaete witrockiana, Strain SAG 46.84" /LENGTH=434 /DNA_ID=CAMNT_0027118671 /DNA_START=276 /DNA_END=1580 /DNA_ORIENTATION=+
MTGIPVTGRTISPGGVFSQATRVDTSGWYSVEFDVSDVYGQGPYDLTLTSSAGLYVLTKTFGNVTIAPKVFFYGYLYSSASYTFTVKNNNRFNVRLLAVSFTAAPITDIPAYKRFYPGDFVPGKVAVNGRLSNAANFSYVLFKGANSAPSSIVNTALFQAISCGDSFDKVARITDAILFYPNSTIRTGLTPLGYRDVPPNVVANPTIVSAFLTAAALKSKSVPLTLATFLNATLWAGRTVPTTTTLRAADRPLYLRFFVECENIPPPAPTATPTRTPTRTRATPTRTKPTATPTKATATKTKPTATKTKPTATRTKPTATRTKPTATRTKPTATKTPTRRPLSADDALLAGPTTAAAAATSTTVIAGVVATVIGVALVAVIAFVGVKYVQRRVGNAAGAAGAGASAVSAVAAAPAAPSVTSEFEAPVRGRQAWV